jgi:hypothetical protein
LGLVQRATLVAIRLRQPEPTILTGAHVWRYWGQGIVAGFIASLPQAAMIYLAVKAMRRRRVVSAR